MHSPADRRELVEVARRESSSASVAPSSATTDAYISAAATAATSLPGVDTLWELRRGGGSAAIAAHQITAVSQRLIDLMQVLGSNDDINVVFMLIREPKLLTTSLRDITKRLFDLRIALAGHMDVSKLLERQPSLLLSDTDTRAQALGDLVSAWQHGLSSDTDAEWAAKFAELQAYVTAHGDAHVGYRAADDEQLTKWCKKQRSAQKDGSLGDARAAQLASVGFAFDEEDAEWRRWYTELRQFEGRHGSTVSAPFTANDDFYLTNWCSVQRIARRAGVMSGERVRLLDELGFDWTGADPLS